MIISRSLKNLTLHSPGYSRPGQDPQLRPDLRGGGTLRQAAPDAVQPFNDRDGGRRQGQAHVLADQGEQGSHPEQEGPLGDGEVHGEEVRWGAGGEQRGVSAGQHHDPDTADSGPQQAGHLLC